MINPPRRRPRAALSTAWLPLSRQTPWGISTNLMPLSSSSPPPSLSPLPSFIAVGQHVCAAAAHSLSNVLKIFSGFSFFFFLVQCVGDNAEQLSLSGHVEESYRARGGGGPARALLHSAVLFFGRVLKSTLVHYTSAAALQTWGFCSRTFSPIPGFLLSSCF